MDGNKISINDLPHEILLLIFRRLSAREFITTLPNVCQLWSKIVTSDSCTIKKIVVSHINHIRKVDFFYLKNNYEQQILHVLSKIPKSVFFSFPKFSMVNVNCLGIFYKKAFDLSNFSRHSEIYNQIRNLMIIGDVSLYYREGFTCANNLTTIIFCRVRLEKEDHHILMDISKAYPNVQNVLYMECNLKSDLDTNILYSEFKQLKRFRLSHHSVCYRDLEDLLIARPKLVEIVLDKCSINDRWIEVLMDKLKGRTVKSLNMHSSYLTPKCVKELLKSDLIDDNSKVNISYKIADIPFSITID